MYLDWYIDIFLQFTVENSRLQHYSTTSTENKFTKAWTSRALFDSFQAIENHKPTTCELKVILTQYNLLRLLLFLQEKMVA